MFCSGSRNRNRYNAQLLRGRGLAIARAPDDGAPMGLAPGGDTTVVAPRPPGRAVETRNARAASGKRSSAALSGGSGGLAAMSVLQYVFIHVGVAGSHRLGGMVGSHVGRTGVVPTAWLRHRFQHRRVQRRLVAG